MTWGWGQSGWVCPKCGRVYSPYTPQCFVCGQPMHVTTGTGTNPDNNKPETVSKEEAKP